MAVITASTNSETGEQQITEQASVKGRASSEDYNPYGVTARGSRGYVVAQTQDQLSDNDIVKFEGMDLTVAQAKEYGVLDQIFGKLDQEASGDAPQDNSEPAESAPADPTVASLQAALEAGEITAEEAQLYDTINAELELAGIDTQSALEAIEEIAKGGNPEISGDARSMLERIHQDVTAASTKAAHAELGPEAYAQLQGWASVSSDVDGAIRGFAAKRATGDRSIGTWSDFYTTVSNLMAGGEFGN